MEIKEEEQMENPQPQIILSEKPFPYNVRQWQPEIEKDKLLSSLKHPNFLTRVVQYNILSDSLLPISTKILEEDLVKLPHLLWENRSKKILSELKTLDADLIGLTEFERDENFIKELNIYGYEFAFKPRVGNHSEGCAISWRNEKYEAIDILSINFNMNKSENNISDIFNRDNIAIIGILKVKDIPNMIIIFATTHLVFNRNRGDIKLGQIYQLTLALEELRKKYEDELKNKVYIILPTDLNCIPRSGVYKLMIKGEFDCNQINKNSISGQDPDNLEKIEEPGRIRGFLFQNMTKMFDRERPPNNYKYKSYDNEFNRYGSTIQENVKWFNEICRIHPVIKEHNIDLDYIDQGYRYKDSDLILKIPFTYKSAYAQMAQNFLDYFNDKYKGIPFNLFGEIDNIEINGLKMGKKEIEKTNSFVKNLTLDNIFTYFSNDTIMQLDYIFYYSKSQDVKVVSILNLPDMYKLFFDIGYMPNEIYPSDHLSIAADLIIGEEK